MKWEKLARDFTEKQSIRIPRPYFCNREGTYDSCYLCGFYDASISAYAAVIYLIRKRNNTHEVSLVTSKTRVAPIKSQTIPRLELIGALLLARLMDSVTQSLKDELILGPSICYTDSKVTLYWIYGLDKDWKPFVQNRQEISTI
jgi:hypothetical protein